MGSAHNLKRNRFSWLPLVEVCAVLPALMLAAMPASAWLAHHQDLYANLLSDPWSLFMLVALSSSVLDNAPISLLAEHIARMMTESGLFPATALVHPLEIDHRILRIIIAGAVYGGPMTIFGNFPNILLFAMARRILGRERVPGILVFIAVSMSMGIPLLWVVYQLTLA